jgi:hypothetical protein
VELDRGVIDRNPEILHAIGERVPHCQHHQGLNSWAVPVAWIKTVPSIVLSDVPRIFCLSIYSYILLKQLRDSVFIIIYECPSHLFERI